MKEIHNIRMKYYFYLILNFIISILPINKKDKEGMNFIYGNYLKDLRKRKNKLEMNDENIFSPEECANVFLRNSEFCRNY